MKYRAKKQHIIHNTKKLLCVALVVATHLLQTGAPAARAAECNEARARIVAYNFCVRQGKVNPAAGAEGLITVSNKYGFSNLHIFNLPDSGGFVIVAGNDCLHPIIGYSFESSLTTIGDNMRDWLNNCERLAAKARSERLEQTDMVGAEWEDLEREDDWEDDILQGGGIPALMSTRWNQSPLYNDSCPYDAGAATHVVTGCVATAMAQVMAYWKRPVTGFGSHSYTHGLYGTLSANFGNTIYDWTNMPYQLDNSSTPAEIRAEAQLVYHCGVAVEMGYGVGGSSAFVVSGGNPAWPCAENALRDYFRFKPSLHSIFEDDMSSGQWLDSMKREFQMGRPVVFAGYQSSGGHAFVLDGYDAFDRVHVNWGWGGMGDGYFTLSPLPMYSAGCQAVVGIEPEGVLYSNKRFFDISEDGFDDTLTVFTSNLNAAGWTAYSNRTWITVTPTSGAGGGAAATLTIHADSNGTGENRSGNVIVRQGNDSINIPIVQYGYHGEDNVLPEDDTIYMDQYVVGEVRVDTIIPGVHYTIMDPGGTGPYPNNCNAKHHLVSSQRSALILNVKYDLQRGSDWLQVYDNDHEEVQLTHYEGCDSNQRVICYSGHAFLSFHSDTYTPRAGYEIEIYACDTFEAEVRNIISVVSGTNTITLSWIDTSVADQWRIKWGTDYRNLDQYREVTETRAVFTNLDLDSYEYYFRIYNNAGAADTGNLCLSRLMMGTAEGDGCPGSPIRDVEIAELLNHSVALRWRDVSINNDGPMHWKVRYGTDRNSLDSVAETDTSFIRLTGLSNGTRYFFRIYNNTISTDSSSACFLMKIQDFTTLECLWDSMDIRNVTTMNVTGHDMDVTWEDYGGGSQWTLTVFKDSAVTYHSDTPMVHLDSLQPGRYYTIIIYNNTGQTDTMQCQQYHGIQTICDDTVSVCVDFTDFSSCLIEPYTGVYDNPSIWPGYEDYGLDNPDSRHTVIHDNAPDSLTGNLLLMIPPDETVSVRLGNSNVGAQGESVNYIYHVDTTVNDLLILKYAAVLENPHHAADEQPRFTLHIVNIDDSPIDDSCYYFDFVSDSTLGWNVHNHVLWKDWTSVGIDLTPLHGQTIKVTLATRDCNQGNHFGYAYYVLRCSNKAITADLCGNSPHNTFRAPKGFAYRWYNNDSPTLTLSTVDTLTVDTAGDYRCTLSPIGSAGGRCSFDMTCRAGYRFPHSQFSYLFTDTVDCKQKIEFTSESNVTNDIEHLIPLSDTLDGVLWDFGDGDTSSDLNPSRLFHHGEYDITLYSSINDHACYDTAVIHISVPPVCPAPDTIWRSICEGDTVMFYGDTLDASGTYEHRDGFWWHAIVLSVLPVSYTHLTDTIVENDLPYSWYEDTVTAGDLTPGAHFSTFHLYYSTVNFIDCDSLIDLTLCVWHNRESQTDTTICPEDLPLQWNELAIPHTGDTTAVLLTTHGADSAAHISIHLFDSPHAAMHVIPEIINLENYQEVQLYDISTGSVARRWELPDATDDRPMWVYSYPIHEDSVIVQLTAISVEGCNDTAWRTLRFFNTALYAPNVFTPDIPSSSDPTAISNDRFQIIGKDIVDIDVYIYNRMGLLVYTWNGIDGYWDGTHQGQKCPQAVYVWKAFYHTADAPGKMHTAEGSVLLLR
ncbi:MAG: C10 family peptidase [Bacteroidales bacterium]|nr:C10 family peptidase [Bacteroidales bacterium]